jgi:hypothetical protein
VSPSPHAATSSRCLSSRRPPCGTFCGQRSRASTRHRQPARPPQGQGRQRRTPGKSRNRIGVQAGDAPGRKPAPYMTVNGHAAPPPASAPARRPGAARNRRKSALGTSHVHARDKKGQRQVLGTSRNSRVPVPLQHLIPAQKVKKSPSNRISVDEGSSAPAGPGRAAPPSPAARWPPAHAFRREPGVKDPAFTGAAPPPRNSSHRARPDLRGDGRPGPPGRPDGP